MATACDDKIPRVNANSLELRAFASEDWQVTCEKLTLSLCRHNVCVVKGFSTEVTVTKAAFHEMSGLLWGTSWIGDSAAGKLQQSLATTEEEPGLLVQPGRHSYTFKLGCSKAEHLTPTQALSCEWAYSEMDCLARQALAAVCRSCHVRLRSDTFSGILDDCPMQPGIPSSSTLRCLQYVNNFSLRSTVGDKWTLAMQQEGVVNKSLVTVIAVNDTRQGTSPNVCKLQVQDALGVWNDVNLQEGEVAIMFGQTATQATAGLLRPAVYRMVGELYGQSCLEDPQAARRELAYHLHARPSAILDFHDVLEEAGHFVADRYAQPVSIKDLLQRFDTVLTPPSMFKHSRSIQLGTIDVATAKKKRKRASMQPSPASSPVTRSGRVRRGNDGLRADPAQPGSSKVACKESEEPTDFAELVQAWRVYITVDGSSACPTEFLPIAIAHYKTLNTMWLRAHPIALCSTIFETYCESMGVELQHVRFLRQNGTRVHGNELLMNLKLKEDEKIIMLPSTVPAADPCPKESEQDQS